MQDKIRSRGSIENIKKFMARCMILILNMMLSFVAVMIYLSNKQLSYTTSKIYYFNQMKEIVKYALVVVIAQVIGLFIIDCWKKNESWLKEAISVLVFYVAVYFIPLGLVWHRHQSNIKQLVKTNPEFYACKTTWFSDLNEPRDFICKIRYLMVVTLIIIVVYIIKEVFLMKIKNKMRYLIYIGFLSVSIGVSGYYLTGEQRMLQLKNSINIDLYYTMMRINGMKSLPSIGDALKHTATEHLKRASKIKAISKSQYDEVLYDIAVYIYNSVYDKEMNEEKLAILDDKFLKMFRAYAVFVQEEGVKCYMGIYTPRDYEVKITQWLEVQYVMLQEE